MQIKMVIFSSLEHLMLVEPSILASMAISWSMPFSEVFPFVLFPLFYSMYNKPSAVFLIPTPPGTFPSKEMLSVKKGVRQGGKTSPSLFDNAIIESTTSNKVVVLFPWDQSIAAELRWWHSSCFSFDIFISTKLRLTCSGIQLYRTLHQQI